MNKALFIKFLLIFLVFTQFLNAQISDSLINWETKGGLVEHCKFKNTSFERHNEKLNPYNSQIGDWESCGFENTSSPTVQVIDNLKFNCKTKPSDGDSYINMVVRQDSTWEAISQVLNPPLEKGATYMFSMNACISPELQSHKNGDGKHRDKLYKFNKPVSIVIKGGNYPCSNEETLFTSEPIQNVDWEELVIALNPNQSFNWLTIEAFYKVDQPFTYDGNVCIDKLSPLYQLK